MANIYSEKNRIYNKYQFLWRTSEDNRNKLKILAFQRKITMSMMIDFMITEFWNSNKLKNI